MSAPPAPQAASQQGPDLMVGAPTEFLSPEIPAPSHNALKVGLELAPGIGISLDGKALLVDNRAGDLKVVGHLKDGTYPQRDFTVTSQGDTTRVDGYYKWQDYTVTRQGDTTRVDGQTDRDDVTAHDDGHTLRVNSHYPALAYTVTRNGNEASARCDWKDGINYQLSRQGDTTSVETRYPAANFSVTHKADGSVDIHGNSLFQDFTLKPSADGYDMKGYYPQQHFELHRA